MAISDTTRARHHRFRRANDHKTTGPMISTSAGIALYPDNGSSAEQLISHADDFVKKRFERHFFRLQVRVRRMQHEFPFMPPGAEFLDVLRNG